MLNGKLSAAFVVAGMLAGAASIGSANAGECPADKMMPNAREAVTFEPSGVTDEVLAALALAKEGPMLADRQMRVRKLVIESDGIVPWHSHADRPALIYILEGEIHEHASNCAGPIVHKAGDVAIENREVSHWWKNMSSAPVTLLAFDLLHDDSDKAM